MLNIFIINSIPATFIWLQYNVLHPSNIQLPNILFTQSPMIFTHPLMIFTHSLTQDIHSPTHDIHSLHHPLQALHHPSSATHWIRSGKHPGRNIRRMFDWSLPDTCYHRDVEGERGWRCWLECWGHSGTPCCTPHPHRRSLEMRTRLSEC